MVSVRRRRLLGKCTGRTAAPVVTPASNDDEKVLEKPNHDVESTDVRPEVSTDSKDRKEGLCNLSGRTAAPVVTPASNDDEKVLEKPNHDVESTYVRPEVSTDSNDRKEVDISRALSVEVSVPSTSSVKPEPIADDQLQGVKRRKRHRRKHVENQEPCTMRGVYFKNMKWQAAIKVEKKQIHLGTVGSQEEAAHLYDRAAFMCGREPNFELSEEEKRELRQLNWEGFLQVTRQAISFKKQQRRAAAGARRRGAARLRSDDEDKGASTSDDDQR